MTIGEFAVPPDCHAARGVADADRVAGKALHRLADRLAADRAGHNLLHIGDVETVAPRGHPIDIDIDIAASGQPFCQCRADARHGPGDTFDAAGDAVQLGEVGPRHFHPDGTLDAGREHIDPIADRRHPYVREAGHAHCAVQLLHQLPASSPRAIDRAA